MKQLEEKYKKKLTDAGVRFIHNYGYLEAENVPMWKQVLNDFTVQFK